MSGIHTNQRFAILDASSGISIDCFKDRIELAKAAIYHLRSVMDDPSIVRWLCDVADEIEADNKETGHGDDA